MNWEPFLTCAVTGAGDTFGKHPDLPVTPSQIAGAAIEAAQAGAAIVHIHVREPSTGQGSRRPEYFREVVERIRDAKTDVLINLTTGMGGDLAHRARRYERHPRPRHRLRGSDGAAGARRGVAPGHLLTRLRQHEFRRRLDAVRQTRRPT